MRCRFATPCSHAAPPRAVKLGLATCAAIITQLAFSPITHADDLQPWTPSTTPALALSTLDGAASSLAALRGNVVIVHFFATWCEPCQTELENLDRLRSDLKDAPLRILAVDVGEPKVRTQRYFESFPVRFPILLDLDKTAMKAWAVDALPASYVLGAGLCPLWKSDGVVDWNAPATRSKLNAAIASLSPPSTLPANTCQPPGEPK